MPELSGNKRIAKNTLLLYLRMFYGLIISLFTARVVLNSLGFTDYGIYNVVGSVVSMFVFLRSALGNATNRYITFSIGVGDLDSLNKVFSTSIIVHFVLGFIIVVLAETIGLWFLYEKMVIPEERMAAAMWCYQFSVLTCFLSVICVPYDAEIIAHEKMGVFAFVQVFNTTMNLGIAYLISHTIYDRLILYGFLLLLIQILNRVFYGFYCGRKFPECHFKWVKDKSLIKGMTNFAGWSLFGNMAYVLQNQGLNILINLFFNTIVNAARAVAFNIQGTIKGFIVNFQTAAFPQITKSYAAKDYSRMFSLIYFVSKFSFFLVLFFGIPVFLESEYILTVWLKSYPPHTINFLRIILLISMVETLVNPLATAISATGNIKTYQILLSVIDLCILPLSYAALKLGCEVESVFLIQLAIICVEQMVRIKLCHNRISLDYRIYFKKVLLRVVCVTLLSVCIPYILYIKMNEGLIRFILVSGTSVISVLVSALFVGMEKAERKTVLGYVLKFTKRNHRD